MTPEEFTAKLEELRTIFADKLVELEENPKWASEDEREEMVKALDELSDQIDDSGGQERARRAPIRSPLKRYRSSQESSAG